MAFLTRTTTRAYRGVVASEAAMLALTATVSDWVTRSDLAGQIFELTALPASAIANWESYPVGAGGGSGDVSADALWDAVGDLAVGTGVNSATRLPMGIASQVLAVNSGGTGLQWSTPASAGSMATDTLWDAAGDLVVGTGSNTGTRLPIGTSLQGLRVNSGGTGLEWAATTAAFNGVTVQEENVSLATAGTVLNFVGDGVTASGTGATKTITIGAGAVQDSLTPASPTLAPSVNAVTAGLVVAKTWGQFTGTLSDQTDLYSVLRPAPVEKTGSFVLTSAEANREVFYNSSSPGNCTWNTGHGMTVGDAGRIIQVGLGALTVVDGTGNLLSGPNLPSNTTSGDGSWIDWQYLGASGGSTDELLLTDIGLAAASGSVATDTIWDAEGDLAVGSGSNTAVRLAKGTALQVLRRNAGNTGLEYASLGAQTLTVINIPSQTAVTTAGADLPLMSVQIPANTLTTGKMLRATFIMKVQASTTDPTAFDLKFGGTLLATNASIPQTFGGAMSMTTMAVIWAVSNSSQHCNDFATLNTNASNVVRAIKKLGAVDATANQDLTLEITTTGCTGIDIQVIGGKIEVI